MAITTTKDLILMVITVAIVILLAVTYIPKIWASIFGQGKEFLPTPFTEVVKCSYLRCTQGCLGSDVSDECFKNFCEKIPQEFRKKDASGNYFICDWNALQYPAESKLEKVEKITKESFGKAARCIVTDGFTWGFAPLGSRIDYVYIVKDLLERFNKEVCLSRPITGDTLAETIKEGTLKAGNFLYIHTYNKAPPGGGVGGAELTTEVTNKPTYLILQQPDFNITKTDYKFSHTEDSKSVPNIYRLVLKLQGGDLEGRITTQYEFSILQGLNTKGALIKVETSLTSEEYHFRENEEHVFKFGTGFLQIRVFTIETGQSVKMSMAYSASGFACTQAPDTIRACPIYSKDVCESQKDCKWEPLTAAVQGGTPVQRPPGWCTGTIRPCSAFTTQTTCETQIACTWVAQGSRITLALNIETNKQSFSKGETATITVTVTDKTSNKPLGEIDVSPIMVYKPNEEGAIYFTSKCTTDSNGKCSVTYTVDMSTGTYKIYGLASKKTDTAKVSFYDDVNYVGNKLELSADIPDLSVHNFNDKISSLKIGVVKRIILYENINYGGQSIAFTTDAPDLTKFEGPCRPLLGAATWNDCASSAKIETTFYQIATKEIDFIVS